MAAADVTNELMYELPKAMPDRMARMDSKLDRIEGELRVIRGHVGALVQSDLLRGSALAELTVPVERIERRLELHDPKA